VAHAPSDLSLRALLRFPLYPEIEIVALNKTKQTNKQTNFVASVGERNIPTEGPPFVGEVTVNF
jgi:hypothetical protein